MKETTLKHKRVWLVVAVVLLIAGHGTLLYYISSHIALADVILPGIVILVVIKLVVIKHRRSAGSLHALFRRSRH